MKPQISVRVIVTRPLPFPVSQRSQHALDADGNGQILFVNGIAQSTASRTRYQREAYILELEAEVQDLQTQIDEYYP